MGFAKIYDSILRSSVWLESPSTKLVWITMLVLADKDGHVRASVGGLAHQAGVSRSDCEEALRTLESPDPDSQTQELEGRRVVRDEGGGWNIVNHSKYREFRTDKQLSAAERSRKHREKKKKEAGGLERDASRASRCVTARDGASASASASASGSKEEGEAEEAPDRPPASPEKAAELPIMERAQALLENPHNQQWVAPHKWPELQKLGADVAEATGWHRPRWSSATSKAVMPLVKLLAEFTADDLQRAVAAMPDEPWLRGKGFSCLSDEVVRRLLAKGQPEQAQEVPWTN